MALKKKVSSVLLSDIKIGIIGGGQMAQMFSTRAHQMGFQVIALSANKFDPVVLSAQGWIKGDIQKLTDIKKLARRVDYLTYESDRLPTGLLKSALKDIQVKSQLFPKLAHLEILQDRWSQKELLWDYQIPTAEFIKLTSKDDLDVAYQVFNGQVVFKKRLSDMNESSTFVIKSKFQLERFKRLFLNQESQFIAEKFIHFKSEKKLIVSRNSKSEVFFYPLMNCEYRNQQVYRVAGPEQHKKISHLTDQITYLLNEIKYVGVLTFELLDTGFDLLINEISPRLHNAGHITHDAFTIDQCELLIRAMLNMNFPNHIQSTQSFLMQNIIGKTSRRPVIPVGLQGKLHWYNKKENSPQKKLGHVNYFGNSIDELKKLADDDIRKIKV